jgi:hypothetical protein
VAALRNGRPGAQGVRSKVLKSLHAAGFVLHTSVSKIAGTSL